MPTHKPKKTGRPPKGEIRERLATITFKADGVTLDALAKLEGAMGAGAMNARSTAIRRALIESAERIVEPERKATRPAKGGIK
jgi:hypothetical protein